MEHRRCRWWGGAAISAVTTLVAALLLVPVVSSASTSSATAALSTTAAHASGVTYTIGLTVPGSGALAGGSGTITVTAGSGTAFPASACAYSVGDSTTNSRAAVCPTGVKRTDGDSTVSFTLPSDLSLSVGDAAVVAITGVTNPAAGSDTIGVSTSTDTTVADASPVPITNPGTVQDASVSASSLVGGETDVTYTVGFDTSATGALVGGQGTVTLGAAVGTVFPSTACDYEVTDPTTQQSADCVTGVDVSAGGASVTFTIGSTVSVAAGDTVNVAVSDVTNAAAGSETLSVATSSDSSVATTQTLVLSGTPGITSSVSHVSEVLTTTVQGATGVTETVDFQASPDGALAEGGAITLVAPVGTVFDTGSGCTSVSDLTTGQSSGCNPASFAGDGSIATISSGVAIGASDEVQVTATGVANPETATSTVAVSTGSDGVFALSPAVTMVTPSDVSSPTLTVSTAASGASQVTDTVGFAASANGALVASQGTITLDAPTGAALPGGGNCDYDVTDHTTGASGCAGGVTPGGPSSSGSSVTFTLPAITIDAGDQVTVDVTGASNPPAGPLALSVSTSSDLDPTAAPAVILSAAKGVTPAATSLTVSTTAAAAADVTDTLTFTTSATGALASGSGDVTITAPTGTGLPTDQCDYAFDDETTQSSSGCATAVTVGDPDAGSTATVTVPLAIRAEDKVSLTVSDVRNPAAGADAFAISTSSDTAPAATSTVTLVAPSAVTPTGQTLSTRVAGATSVTATVGFAASSSGGLEAGDGTITVTGSPGTQLPGNNCAYTVDDTTTATSGCAQNVDLDGAASSADVTVPEAVNPGDAVTLTITGVTNPAVSERFAVSTSSDTVVATEAATTVDAGAAVANPSLSVSSPVAGAVDVTDTISFTTTGDGALAAGQGWITLDTTPGTDLPDSGCNYTIDDTTTGGSNGCVNTTGYQGDAISVQVGTTVRAGDDVSVTVTGVDDPPAGPQSVTVATTSDPVPATASPVTLAAPTSPVDVTSTLSDAAAGATGVTDTVTFTASSQGAALAGTNVVIDASSSTSFSSNGCEYTITDETTQHSQSCLSVGVGGAGNVVTVAVPFQINPGDTIQLVVLEVTNPTINAQQVQVSTATDIVPAAAPAVTLTGGTTPTSVTSPTVSLSDTAASATSLSGQLSFDATTASSGLWVDVEASPGVSFPDGNGCDYTVVDTTTGQSANCPGVNANGYLLEIGTSITVNAGDHIVLSVPLVNNDGGPAESFTVSTSVDQEPVTAPTVDVTAAGAVGSPALSLSSEVAGRGGTTWTVGFTASATGALDSSQGIGIVAPPGTQLNGNGCDITVSDVTTQHSANCVGASVSAGGQDLVVGVPSFGIKAGDAVTVTIDGVTNPSGTAAAVSVSTSADSVPASTSPVTLAAGQALGGVHASLSPAVAGAAYVTGTFDLTASATGALGAGTDWIAIEGGAGSSFPGNGCDYTVIDETTGQSASCVPGLSLVADGSTVSLTVPSGVPVSAGDAVEVVVTDLGNPPADGAGSDPFSIATSADTMAASTAVTLAAPSSPADVSATLSNDSEGASDVTATIALTTVGGGLAPASAITFSGSPGTLWPGSSCDYTITDTTTGHSTNCVAGLAVTSDGAVATLTTQDSFTVKAGDTVTVAVSGFTNPAATSDDIGVATSSDQVRAPVETTLAAANPVTSPTATVSTDAAGAPDVTYTVGFTASASGGLADGQGIIALSAGPGTRFPASACDYTVTDTTNTHSAGCVGNLVVQRAGSEVSLLVPGGFTVDPGDAVVVSVTGVTNPGDGTDALSIATSSDVVRATTAALTFRPATKLSSTSFSPSSAAVGQSGVAYTVGFTASATGDLQAGSGTITLVAAAGTSFGGGGWCADVDDVTADRASSCDQAVVSGDGSAVTVTTGTEVHPGDAVVLTVTDVTNPPVSGAAPAELWTSSDFTPVQLASATLSGSAISGTVETTSDGTTSGVGGVTVQACPTSGGPCVNAGTTPSGGDFSIAVSAGTYTVTATPPPAGGPGSSSSLQSAEYGPVTVAEGASATGIVVNLPAEEAVPSGATVNGETGSVPTIYWDSASTLSITGCPDGMADVNVQGTDEQSGATILRTLPLTESPPGSGTYTGTIPPLYPVHGNVTIAGFVYCATATAVLPYAGPTSGGTTVTIDGTGFGGATAVAFGGVPASSFTVVSDDEITAVTPPGSGAVAVTVTTPHGTTAASSLLHFTYLSVTGVAPDTGPVAGDGTVAISGTGFSSAQQVFFGQTRILFRVISDSKIIAWVPPGAQAGALDVTVETSGGTSAVSPADTFTYSATASTPSTPQAPPSTTVPAPPPACTTSTGPSPCSAPPAQRLSAEPPLSDTYGGSVSNPGALASTISSANTYAYTPTDTPPDSASDWTPLQTVENGVVWFANAAGGIDTVAGALDNLDDGYLFASDVAEGAAFDGAEDATADTIGDLLADSALEDGLIDFALGPIGGLALGAFQVYCATANPGGALGGVCDVANLPSDLAGLALTGLTSLLQKLFNAYIDPSGSVIDDDGNPVAGATVTILASSSGSEAGPYSAVAAGAASIQPSTDPETTGADGQFAWNVVAGWYEIEASKTGCHDPGHPADLDASTAAFAVPPPQDGLEITLTCQGEAAPSVPSVTGLSSSSGPAAGGSQISIEGSGFAAGDTVKFGSQPAASITVVSSTDIEAVTPVGSGAVDVTVSNSAGTSSNSPADGFVYVARPVVTGLSLHSGNAVGGSSVEIDGSGFSGATGVFFGATGALGFELLSNTRIVATAPSGTGVVDVTVLTVDGSSVTSTADRFTYAAPFALTTRSLPAATVGTKYSQTLVATGGVSPYSWSRVSGALPPGLGLSSAGVIAGTATKAGTFDLGVRVADSDVPRATATVELSLTVKPKPTTGYWLVTSKGAVYGFGSVKSLGSEKHPSSAVVGIASAPTGKGYWLVTSKGAVYGFGSVKSLGSEKHPSSAVVGIASAPTGKGYWLVTSKGAVYGFGSGLPYGGLTQPASAPVTAIGHS